MPLSSTIAADDATSTPYVYQLCPAAKAPADRWVVERALWGADAQVSLHILEAEVLRPQVRCGNALQVYLVTSFNTLSPSLNYLPEKKP